MTTKIAITTPTGKNGRALTKRLLDVAKENQLEIVLLARDPEKVSEFSERGARVEKGNLNDAVFVARATAGVDALFWLTPQNFEPGEEVRAGYNRYGRIGAEAVKRNGIPHVVHLSGFDTEKDGEGGQIVDGLADVERLLNDVATNITHVRAAFFLENYLGQLDPIKSQGSVYMPVKGDTSVAMVATQDIAEVAARELLALDWSGRRVVSAMGPKDLTFDEAAAALSEGIGRQVAHVTVTPEQARESMLGSGMSPGMTDGFLAIFAAGDAGLLRWVRNEASTTPTTMEAFARTVLRPMLG